MRQILGSLRRQKPIRDLENRLRLQVRLVRQKKRGAFVRGVWKTTSEYVAQNFGNLVEYHRLLPASESHIPAPTFLGKIPISQSSHPLAIPHPEAFFASLLNAWVVGRHGFVVAPDRQMLWDLSYDWPGNIHEHPIWDWAGPDAATPFLPGTTVSLVNMGSDNYFHFLMNTLPRIKQLTANGELEKADRILIGPDLTPARCEAFRAFGIDLKKAITTAEYPVFQAERLVIPSLVLDPFMVPAWVPQYLREVLSGLGEPPAPPIRRFIVDRSDTPLRQIENLDALSSWLTNNHIQRVRLGELTFAQQIGLFQNAELIIARHGAGLSNLTFCRPGTRVVQILAPGAMEREFRTLGYHLGLRHDYIYGTLASEDSHLAPKNRSVNLDVSLLEEVL